MTLSTASKRRDASSDAARGPDEERRAAPPAAAHRRDLDRESGLVARPSVPSPETVALITPSHRADLERCALLFESIDRHIARRGPHYVIVHDDDHALFERFARPDRRILRTSEFVPPSLTAIPVLRWRGRRYWISRSGRLVSGWHVQQMVKIQAASSLPEERFCIIDSDNVFFRDFDLSRFAAPNPLPFHVHKAGITVERPRHLRWIASTSRLIGTPPQSLPADDYIDQVIFWDKATVRAMTDRIEAITGRDWVEALCRERDFSEYIIYGNFVAHSAEARTHHRETPESLCRTYWDHEVLSRDDILGLIADASDNEAALCLQSFGPTPVATIRESLAAYYAGLRRGGAEALRQSGPVHLPSLPTTGRPPSAGDGAAGVL